LPHQDEEGYHSEAVRGSGLIELHPQYGEAGFEGAEDAEAEEAHQGHAEADLHPEGQEDEQKEDAD